MKIPLPEIHPGIPESMAPGGSRSAAWCLSSLLFLVLVLPKPVVAQDPFFTQFTLSESYFNPALTGYRGALSVMGKYKTQWHLREDIGFRTASLALEESLPCSPFDYGLHLGVDREGEGLLTTTDAGARGAGTVAWEMGRSIHNLRFGISLQWSAKRVDYSRLVFSDQLDAKYGTVDVNGVRNPTSFVPFNDGRSLWFFTPAVGFSHRILLDRQQFRSPTIHYGMAMHNAFTFGDRRQTGNVESILDLDTRIPQRFHAFFSTEFVAYSDGRTFLGLRPLVAWQQQGPISYCEVGNRFSLNRNMAVGLHYHFNPHGTGTDRYNSNWFSLQAEFGTIVQRTRRLEFGLCYAGNVTGVRNHFGPIIEVSMAVHFASSPTCSGLGLQDEVPYGDGVRCPTSSITTGRSKMYESIWYK